MDKYTVKELDAGLYGLYDMREMLIAFLPVPRTRAQRIADILTAHALGETTYHEVLYWDEFGVEAKTPDGSPAPDPS